MVSKSVFPESGSNNEWSRYLYYLGRIKAIQLEYSQAHTHLLQAIRKAPQHTAVGFKQTVQKLLVTVELLLGDIPERHLFRQSTMRYALAPYFQMTQAVRLGDIHRFNKVLETYGNMFQVPSFTYTFCWQQFKKYVVFFVCLNLCLLLMIKDQKLIPKNRMYKRFVV